MKKVLIASTALVAATMFSAGAASASEKIKLNLGGYSKWWVVGAWQDNSFQANNNAAGAQGDYNNVDIKGDNEVFFGGSTTLDNGLKVGINIELEAGGNTGAGASDNADQIDKSVVFVEGGFGKVLLGTEANGAALLHVFAPDAAGNTDSDGIITGGWAIARPTNNTAAGRVSTSIDTDGDTDKITYVSPSFYGLTVGGTYAPNTAEDNRTTPNLQTVVASNIYGAGGLYANSFGGVDLKVSGGWATYEVENGIGFNNGKSGVNEYTVGTQVGYAGFTVGGSFRKINSTDNLDGVVTSGQVWDAGIQYASGPYAVSFIYFESTADSTVSVGNEDSASVYQVSGKYALGPGVDALASVGHADYDTAGNADANDNKGWAVMTGLSLAF